MTRAPRVLVVAHIHGPADSARILHGVARQTYRETQVVFVRQPGEELPSSPVETVVIFSVAELAAHLEKSVAERVLFWPEEGELRESALEKLVLALQLAPDQDGVADAAQGETGLWLARRTETMTSLITSWIDSPRAWIEVCRRRKPALFFLPENLHEVSSPFSLKRPYAVGDLFGKLPLRLENYQSIASEPVWTCPAEAPDSRSILFLVSSLPMGGACKFILDLAGELKARGYRVTVATTAYDINNPNRWLDELLRIVPDVFVLSHARPVEMPRLIVHLARTHRCGRVVLSHSMLGYQLLPWLRSELPDVAFLDYTHIEYETEYPDGGYARRSVNHQALLELSLVSSHHLRAWMVDHGADDASVRVCPTNIDSEKWRPDAEARARVRHELGIDSETALILYPCRLAEQKRPELMGNIIATLRRVTQVPFLVVVAGDGPLLPALRKFVEKQGLDNCFRLLGAVSLERVAQLHHAADIFLLPSLIEGISLALFEAMALETVPVVADVGGQRELVTGECGYLIPLGEAADEAAHYVAILKHLLEDPAQRRRKAHAARARVRDHFPLRRMTEIFMAALDEADERRRSRSPSLPDAAVCREMATLAIDHLRVTYEGSLMLEHGCLLHERMTRQEKINLKLQRQLETWREAQRRHQDHELPC